LSDLSDDELAAWGLEYPADLDYRVELARRIALKFGDADQLILFDDSGMMFVEWERRMATGLRSFERPLLPTLWLSLGFRRGAKVLVYAPPNPVEMDAFLKLKRLVEQHLQRTVIIQILYEDALYHLLELIAIFEENPENYTAVCEAFAQRPASEYYAEYHVDMLKRHLETITHQSRRSFVFPFLMTDFHQQELQPYSDLLALPDVPSNDKAQHNLFLRSKGFTALPQLLVVFPDGSVIDNYEQYVKTLKHLDLAFTINTPRNIEVSKRQVSFSDLHLRESIPNFLIHYEQIYYAEVESSET